MEKRQKNGKRFYQIFFSLSRLVAAYNLTPLSVSVTVNDKQASLLVPCCHCHVVLLSDVLSPL